MLYRNRTWYYTFNNSFIDLRFHRENEKEIIAGEAVIHSHHYHFHPELYHRTPVSRGQIAHPCRHAY